jgi:hypothetical protein
MSEDLGFAKEQVLLWTLIHNGITPMQKIARQHGCE